MGETYSGGDMGETYSGGDIFQSALTVAPPDFHLLRPWFMISLQKKCFNYNFSFVLTIEHIRKSKMD